MSSEASDFVVADDEAGRRADVVLAERRGISRSAARGMIEAGDVRVDGAQIKAARTLRANERVEVAAAREPDAVEPPDLPPVRYEDAHLVVIAKPAGLVVHEGTGHRGDTLVDALVAAGVRPAGGEDPSRPGIVHRLDRDTSGLMVVARSQEAYDGMVDQLRQRHVDRRYIALVEGQPTADHARIEGAIGRDPNDRTRFAVTGDGKPATTRWRRLANGHVDIDDRQEPVTQLACRLATGRTHQIRVHLSAAGHPVVADRLYGAHRRLAAALGMRRHALHAIVLAFDHPVTGQRVEVHEPLPDDLVEACVRAGLPSDIGRDDTWPADDVGFDGDG